MKFVPLGDSALTLVVGDGISRELSGTVLRVSNVLRSTSLALNGLVEVVPAYASLTLFYDPLQVTCAELLEEVEPLVEQSLGENSALDVEPERTVRIPVRYDGEDLAEVAERTGHTTEQVVALHSGRVYRVYVIGFVPGFAYLGDLDPLLTLPRRTTPRKRVPAGAVAIAEAQTGIYPFSTPGGWHLIGSTTTTMFDPSAADPALLRVGDGVVFEPVD